VRVPPMNLKPTLLRSVVSKAAVKIWYGIGAEPAVELGWPISLWVYSPEFVEEEFCELLRLYKILGSSFPLGMRSAYSAISSNRVKGVFFELRLQGILGRW